MSKFRTYKSYENLEGMVNKTLKKILKIKRGREIPSAIISMNIWNKAIDELRLPTDVDISMGVYEFFGDTRQYN